MTDILDRIRNKEDTDKIIADVVKNPEIIDTLVEVIKTDKSAFKFNCEKIVRFTAENHPELVYPHFDFFSELLHSENSFLKWGSVKTVAYMTAVDEDDKFEKIFDDYYGLFNEKKLIATNNVLACSDIIAKNKPHLIDKIVEKVLTIDETMFLHKEKVSKTCKNIAYGTSIGLFVDLFETSKHKDEIREFVRGQKDNKRPKVVKNYKRFVKKFGE